MRIVSAIAILGLFVVASCTDTTNSLNIFGSGKVTTTGGKIGGTGFDFDFTKGGSGDLDLDDMNIGGMAISKFMDKDQLKGLMGDFDPEKYMQENPEFQTSMAEFQTAMKSKDSQKGGEALKKALSKPLPAQLLKRTEAQMTMLEKIADAMFSNPLMASVKPMMKAAITGEGNPAAKLIGQFYATTAKAAMADPQVKANFEALLAPEMCDVSKCKYSCCWNTFCGADFMCEDHKNTARLDIMGEVIISKSYGSSWWIWLLVILLVVAIGVAGYIFYTKRKQQSGLATALNTSPYHAGIGMTQQA